MEKINKSDANTKKIYLSHHQEGIAKEQQAMVRSY